MIVDKHSIYYVARSVLIAIAKKIVCENYATKTSVQDQNPKAEKPFQVGRMYQL